MQIKDDKVTLARKCQKINEEQVRWLILIEVQITIKFVCGIGQYNIYVLTRNVGEYSASFPFLI